MEQSSLYQLALTRIHGIGPAHTKWLVDRFGTAEAVFRANRPSLAATGIKGDLVDAILHFKDFAPLQQELLVLRQKGIRTLFFTDPDYPRRLLTYTRIPPLLFYQGAADLNAKKIIAVAGTRTPTDYGRRITRDLIRNLAQPGLLIASGLAFGIDAAAHRAALEYNIPTIGILGSGISHIYPREHLGLARSMRGNGGLISSFGHDIHAEHYSFPARNMLVAAICDALIVVETKEAGGSLITAAYASGFHKKIFAVPGRLIDEKSRGCLNLIQSGKARPLFSARQLQAEMGWDWPAGNPGSQAILPFSTGQPSTTLPSDPEPSSGSAPPATPAPSSPSPAHPAVSTSAPDQQLLSLLRGTDTLSLDQLAASSHRSIPSVSAALLHLEMQGLIRALPGRRYRLNSCNS